MEQEYSEDYLGSDFIGQQSLRQRISFMINGHKQTGFIESLLFISRFGAGKTTVCRKIMSNLRDENNQPKKQIEINSASLQNVDGFFDQIIIPHVATGEKVSLFFDELDCASPKVHNSLLTILQYDAVTKQSQTRHDGALFDFSFKNLSVLASTTDPQRIHPALLSRFRQMEMDDYTTSELCQILYRYTPNIKYMDNVELQIVAVSRKNPRYISLRLSNDINQYCRQKNKETFDKNDWQELTHLLKILPQGLTTNELMVLKHLKQGACTLTGLCAKMNMPVQTLRRNIELYLLAENYIKIENKRFITEKGSALVDEIEKNY